MATTTNYGWTTPDDTALVKDGASAIRTLGSSVDTTTKNLNPSTTLGDIEYRSSTSNVNTRLGIGSTGNVLTVSGGVPVWSAPAGGGKVLQVVSSSISTTTSTTSATYVTATNMNLSITPTSASSKILILATVNIYFNRTGDQGGTVIKLLRGSTSIFVNEPIMYIYQFPAPTINQIRGSYPVNFLDSPATTSSTNYNFEFHTYNGTSIINNNPSSIITLLEIGA